MQQTAPNPPEEPDKGEVVAERRLWGLAGGTQGAVGRDMGESLLGVEFLFAVRAEPGAGCGGAGRHALLELVGVCDEGAVAHVAVGERSCAVDVGAGARVDVVDAGGGLEGRVVGVVVVLGGLPEGEHVFDGVRLWVGGGIAWEDGDERVEVFIVDTGFATEEMLYYTENFSKKKVVRD